MKHYKYALLLVWLLMISCAPTPPSTLLSLTATATPTNIPILTNTPTATPTETLIPTNTPTATPTLTQIPTIATATATLTLIPTVTAIPIPLPPSLEHLRPTYTWKADLADKRLIPEFSSEGSTVKVIEDPTGLVRKAIPNITDSRVVESNIFDSIALDGGPLKDGHHRAYIPRWDSLVFEGQSHAMPARLDAWIYIESAESDIGRNPSATKGKQVFALAGDLLLDGFKPFVNNILTRNSGKYYLLPMAHNPKTSTFTLGRLVNPCTAPQNLDTRETEV